MLVAALALLTRLRPDVGEVLSVAAEGDKAVQTAQQLVYQVRAIQFQPFDSLKCTTHPAMINTKTHTRLQLPHLLSGTIAPTA